VQISWEQLETTLIQTKGLEEDRIRTTHGYFIAVLGDDHEKTLGRQSMKIFSEHTYFMNTPTTTHEWL